MNQVFVYCRKISFLTQTQEGYSNQPQEASALLGISAQDPADQQLNFRVFNVKIRLRPTKKYNVEIVNLQVLIIDLL